MYIYLLEHECLNKQIWYTTQTHTCHFCSRFNAYQYLPNAISIYLILQSCVSCYIQNREYRDTSKMPVLIWTVLLHDYGWPGSGWEEERPASLEQMAAIRWEWNWSIHGLLCRMCQAGANHIKGFLILWKDYTLTMGRGNGRCAACTMRSHCSQANAKPLACCCCCCCCCCWGRG